ncbi:hypothetical protein FZEAL_883 [Fusarium zealandicum]|uniref:Major facilitator superfamily (MFS) profile domain-containing protein n=1 Tax=Fusarium zealandicum TaxID=1053134 RepID=A0A8H4UUI6_9HYPO|nr:hypothetical protein FZEAL_883 [Fusarium zealandicum]
MGQDKVHAGIASNTPEHGTNSSKKEDDADSIGHGFASAERKDLLSLEDLDPALAMKMHLVNNAIDEIGWTPYHWKLFVLNGFGYAADSLVLLLQSIIAASAFKEFGQVGYSAGLNVAAYVGMLLGALFWGLFADIIGRRWAFNSSLFVCSTATIIAGAMPNWSSLGFFIAIIGFGGGGNLILDTTVFLEYLPSSKQWALTLMAAWWGLGQAIVGFIAWGFMSEPKWNCSSVDDCPKDSNWGWRYVMFTGGALVLAMSVARVTVIRLKETPKYLLGTGDDASIIETFQGLANRYNRPCSLTLQQLESCGVVHSAHSKNRFSIGEALLHVRGLFSTRTVAASTCLTWLSWTLIGLAYPLFYVFITPYLATRVADEVSTYDGWRNYALTNISGIFGPIIAAGLCNTSLLGRKYTMVIGALLTMSFFFAYTSVSTAAQNLGFSCAIACCVNIYYGVLYAYTAEVLPSAHRATGSAIAVACNRVMGIISSVIATTSDTSTSVPIYVCAGLYVVMAIVSVLLPFEPYGRRSS